MSQPVRINASRRGQSGFSLLEMLISVGILSAAAYVALDMVDGNVDHTREQVTVTRLEKIRKAVVGDPDLSLNGSPMVAGFVADIGVLPPCLDALINQNPSCADEYPDFGSNVLGLSSGWRGPYVQLAGTEFRDGWRNDFDDANGNLGWQYTLADPELDVFSIGKDRKEAGNAEDTGDNLEMQKILASDHQHPSGLVTDIELTLTAATAGNVCIAIVYPKPQDSGVITDDEDWELAIHNGGPVALPVGDTVVTVTLSSAIPFGVRPLLVYDPAHTNVSATCAVNGADGDFLTGITASSTIYPNGPLLGMRNLLFVPGVTPTADISFKVN